MFDTSFNHFKSVLAHQFFVLPADRNYFLARFTRIYGLPEEFWWQSLQAIEKYLKAGLLLNGESVKSSNGHEIFSLWERHTKIFGELAVADFVKPPALNQKYWTARTVGDFIRDVAIKGHPDSRYGLLSRWETQDDLFKLDQLVFELRRRTIGLDWVVGSDWPATELEQYEGKPYRDVILAEPEHPIRAVKTPSGALNIGGEDLTDLFHAWNFAFTRSPEDLSRNTSPHVAPAIAAGNSYIYLLLEALEHEEVITPPVIERIQWLLDNIKLGKADMEDFKDRIGHPPA